MRGADPGRYGLQTMSTRTVRVTVRRAIAGLSAELRADQGDNLTSRAVGMSQAPIGARRRAAR